MAIHIDNLYVADFETIPYSQYLKEKKARVWLFYIENLFNDKDKKLGLSIDDYFKWLIKDKIDKKIYFHNLSFDGEFILWYLTSLKLNYVSFKNQKFRDSKEFKKLLDNYFTYFKDEKDSIYNIECKINGVELQFFCSYKILTCGVDKLPNINGGFDKDFFDYDYKKEHYEKSINEVDIKEINYIKNDVRKVKNALLFLNGKIGLANMTAASMAYYQWENVFLDDWEIKNNRNKTWMKWLLTVDESRFYHKFFHGGFTHLFDKWRNILINQKIYGADVNSMYPNVMISKPMPLPLKNKCNDNLNCNHLKLITITVENLKIKKGYIPFLQKNNVFTMSSQAPKYIEGLSIHYITNIEFELIKKYYTWDKLDFKISECFKKKWGLFNKYINYWYDIKCNSVGWTKFLAKIMLNSLFGKFGTKPNKPSRIMINKEPDVNFNKYNNYYEFTELISDDDFIEAKTTKKGKINLFYNPIAIFITAYARCELINIAQLNRKGFIYCDTDSIYSIFPIIGVKFHDNKLGYWKKEGVNNADGIYYFGGKFLNKKQYILFKNKEATELLIKVCGMSEKKQSMINVKNFNYDYNYIGGKIQRKKVEGGLVLIDSDFKITNIQAKFDKLERMIESD